MSAKRSPITTHALDLSRGKAVTGLPVELLKKSGSTWISLARSTTNQDGRVEDFLAPGSQVEVGIYRLQFEVAALSLGPSFYPEICITFEVKNSAEHHHVPLLLSPYGYSTYRGT